MGFKDNIEFLYSDDLYSHPNGRKVYQILSICVAEFLGTFFLMVIGCAGYLKVIPFFGLMVSPMVDRFSIALGWGFLYGALYIVVHHISGYFLNPALVVTMVFIGYMSLYRMLMYMLCEFLGAIVGIMFLKFTIDGLPDDFCTASPPPNYSDLNAMLYEAFGTFSLGLLFCGIYDPRTRDNFSMGGVKFAFSMMAIILGIIKYTGCSMNPARSVATSIISMNFDKLWIYLAGPFGGAIIAGIYYQIFFHNSIKEPSQQADEEE